MSHSDSARNVTYSCSLTSITRIQSHTYSCTPLIHYICHIYYVCPLSNVLTTNTPGVLYYMKRINILVKSNNKAVIRVYNVFQVFNSCVMNRFFSDALVILLVWVCRKAFSPHHMSMTNRTHFQKSELQFFLPYVTIFILHTNSPNSYVELAYVNVRLSQINAQVPSLFPNLFLNSLAFNPIINGHLIRGSNVESNGTKSTTCILTRKRKCALG